MPAAVARLVLLGASNLALGLAHAVGAARAASQGPVEVLSAHGLGRSYGLTTRVLFRELPAITHCGLWEALQGRPPAATRALITDVGNDLLYGVHPDQVLAWVDDCAARLTAHGAELTIATLPMEAVRRVGPLRFGLMRRLLFPSSQQDRATVLARAAALDEGLRALARRRAARLVIPDPHWYGVDPVHVRRSRRAAAWRELLGVDPAFAPTRLPAMSPHHERRFGRERRRTQPCAVLPDGTTVAWY